MLAQSEATALQGTLPRLNDLLILRRQYNVDSTSQNLGRVVTDTWRSLTMEERIPYERVASNDMVRYQREQRSYQEVQRRYTELRAAAEQDGKFFSLDIFLS